MAVNLPHHGTWDPLTSTRAPIIGDISTQYDITTDTHRTAVYDGQRWVEMNNQTSVSHVAPTIGSSSIVNSTNAKINTIADNFLHERMFNFMKENIRVAEYTDASGKIHTVQLEMREGPNFIWEPIKRVKIKNTL